MNPFAFRRLPFGACTPIENRNVRIATLIVAVLMALPAAARAGGPGAVGDLYVVWDEYPQSIIKQIEIESLAPRPETFGTLGGGLTGGVAFGPNGDVFTTIEPGITSEILQTDGRSGEYVREFADVGDWTEARALGFGPSGNLFVACQGTDQVREFDGQTGAFVRVFASGSGLSRPVGLAFGPSGNLFVTSQPVDSLGRFLAGSILEFDGASGAFVRVLAADITESQYCGSVLSYSQLTALGFGPSGHLFAVIASNTCGSCYRVVKLDATTGAVLLSFANTLNDSAYPCSVAFDLDGRLYVGSCGDHNYIREYNPVSGARVRISPPFVASGAMACKPSCPAFTPTLAQFYPPEADNCGMLTGTTISGSGLSATCASEIKLVQAGQPDILATRAISGLPLLANIEADFDLSGAAPGSWDLVFAYADGQSDTLAHALEITQCAAPVVTGFSPGQQANCGVFLGAVISGDHFAAAPQPTVRLTRAGQPDIIGTVTAVEPPTSIVADFDLGGAAVGFWNAVVTNPDGQSAKLSDALAVTECTGPVVSSFSPASVDNCAPLMRAVITGSSFLPGSTVRLARSGRPDILGTNVLVESALVIIADFDVTMAVAGAWDVVVTHPGGASGTLPGGLELTSCLPPQVTGFAPAKYENCTWLTGARVSGTYFTPGMKLALSKPGQPEVVGQNVIFVSADMLQADFQMTDAAPGVWDLTVIRPDGQVAAQTGALNLVACAEHCLPFANPQFPVGQELAACGPRAIACADFDGDGVLDLATPTSLPATLSILFGRGDGRFAPGVEYPVPAMAIAAGDLNGDGHPDLAVTLHDPYGLGILLNNGDGTFARLVSYSVNAREGGIALGDLDGDGDLDVLVPLFGSEIAVIFNNGDGTFGAPVVYGVRTHTDGSVAIGDLDGDGDLDLAIGVSYLSFHGVSFLFNAGDGTFPRRVDWASHAHEPHLALSDLDGDGDLDLLIVDSMYGGDSGLGVAFNNGSGLFGRETGYSMSGGESMTVTTVDVDGDGDQDVVVAATYVFIPPTYMRGSAEEVYSDAVWVFFNDGAGGLGTPVTYHGSLYAMGIAVGDLNGDGRPDLALGDYRGACVSVLLNVDGRFASDVLVPVAGGLSEMDFVPGLALGDLNNDGYLDLIAGINFNYDPYSGGHYGGKLVALLNDGSGTSYVPTWSYDLSPLAPGWDHPALGDIDGDGNIDMVDKTRDERVTPAILSVRMWFGNGDGTFGAPVTIDTLDPAEFGSLALADLNGDSLADLVVPTQSDPPGVWILLSAGRGAFLPPVKCITAGLPWDVVVGDVNGDGLPDLVIISGDYDSHTFWLGIHLNHGDGTFEPEIAHLTPVLDGPTGRSALADFDGHGHLDLAVVSNGTLWMMRNDGGGQFEYGVRLPCPDDAWEIVAGDLDGDGDVDLAIERSNGSGSVWVVFNRGDGTFDADNATEYGLGIFSNGLSIGDLNNDGRLDLAAATQGPVGDPQRHLGAVSVLLNRAPAAAISGDLNCDGLINTFDIDPFVLALTDPNGYAASFPNCDRMAADCNGDGAVDAFDIDAFVGLLVPTGACCYQQSGQCEDGVAPAACAGLFYHGGHCAALSPPCGNPGACCDVQTGVCADGIPEAQCQNEFHAGSACTDLDPACGNPGCCCDAPESGVVTPPRYALAADCDGRFIPGPLSGECVAEAFDPACGLGNRKYLYAPAANDNPVFRAQLSALLGGQTVDYFAPHVATPSVDYLAQYAAVMTWCNYAYQDPVLMGNNLAAYVDQGGRVILGQFCLPTAGPGYGLAGRIMSNPAYCPAIASTWACCGWSYNHDGTQCATAGVGDLHTDYLDMITGLKPGAHSDGTIDGSRCAIWNAGMNVWYSPGNLGGSYESGDWATLTYKELTCQP